MSVGYVPKNELTARRALSAQELMIRGSDYSLYRIDGTSIIVLIREPVSACYVAELKVDSTNLNHEYNQASIAVVDSNTSASNPSPLSGYNEFGQQVSDQGGIQLSGVGALNPNDTITIKYRAADHL